MERHQELNSTIELLAREMSHLGGKSPSKNTVVEEEELKTCWNTLRPLAEVPAFKSYPGDGELSAGVRRSVRLSQKAGVDYRLSAPWLRSGKEPDWG